MRRKVILYGSVTVLCVYGIIALAAPLIVPAGPTVISSSPLQPPSPAHWFGTNELGQDNVAQLVWGARITLLFGFCAAALSVTISTAVGTIAGYYGGIVDEVICRAIDIVVPIPRFVLLLVITTFFMPGILMVTILMGLLSSIFGIRIIRSQVLSIARMEYVEGAKAIGASDLRIMVRHILPNMLPLVIVKFVSTSQHLIVIGVGLSFIGMWDTSTVDWGTMIQNAYSGGGLALGLWWWILPPGIAVVILSLTISMIGYGLEEKSNPRVGVNRQ